MHPTKNFVSLPPTVMGRSQADVQNYRTEGQIEIVKVKLNQISLCSPS